jgi:hypothetical protein
MAASGKFLYISNPMQLYMATDFLLSGVPVKKPEVKLISCFFMAILNLSFLAFLIGIVILEKTGGAVAQPLNDNITANKARNISKYIILKLADLDVVVITHPAYLPLYFYFIVSPKFSN